MMSQVKSSPSGVLSHLFFCQVKLQATNTATRVDSTTHVCKLGKSKQMKVNYSRQNGCCECYNYNYNIGLLVY